MCHKEVDKKQESDKIDNDKFFQIKNSSHFLLETVPKLEKDKILYEYKN